jgi:hypothetical protein
MGINVINILDITIGIVICIVLLLSIKSYRSKNVKEGKDMNYWKELNFSGYNESVEGINGWKNNGAVIFKNCDIWIVSVLIDMDYINVDIRYGNDKNYLFYLENSYCKDTSIESLKILLENILIEKCRRLDKNIKISEEYEKTFFIGSVTYLNLKNAYKFYLKLKKENEKLLNLSSEGIRQNIIILEEDTKCEELYPCVVDQIKEICNNIKENNKSDLQVLGELILDEGILIKSENSRKFDCVNTLQSKVYEKIVTKGNRNCIVSQRKSFIVNLNSVKLNIHYVDSNDFKTEFKFITIDDKIINSEILKDEFEIICKVLDSIIIIDSCDMYLMTKEVINNFNYMSKLTKTDIIYSGFIEKGVCK